MENMCRFCLNISSDVMCHLSEESKLWIKLTTLNIKICLNSSLPNQICSTCCKTIEDFYNFRHDIVKNELDLVKLINTGYHIGQMYAKVTDKKRTRSTDHNPHSDAYDNALKGIDIIKEYTSNDKNECNDFRHTYPMSCIKPEDTGADHITDNIDFEYERDETCVITISTSKNESQLVTKSPLKHVSTSKHKVMKSIRCKEQRKKVKTKSPGDVKSKWDINADLKINYVKHPELRCLSCLSYYNNRIDLLNHYNDVHGKKDDFDNRVTQIAEDSNIYKCKFCNVKNNDKEVIMKHVSDCIFDRPFVCKLCGRTFKRPYEIMRHTRVHSGRQLYCSHRCGFSTAHDGALKDHEKRHVKDYKFTCATCNKGFHVRTWYEQHQNLHKNLRPFACHLCAMTFHMQRYLMAHLRTVHPEEEVSNVRRYSCAVCTLMYSSKDKLIQHLKVHEIGTRFLCDECGKVFNDAKKLKNHKQIHLQLRPHKCCVCNKSFAKKSSLVVHQRGHSGDDTRDHRCSLCGKLFVQRSSLTRHVRTIHSRVAE